MSGVSADGSYYAVLAGLLLAYWECLRPGWFVPGVAGLALASWGLYALAGFHPSTTSVVLTALGLALAAVGRKGDLGLILGGAAIGLFGAAAWTLFPPRAVARAVAGLLFGTITYVLAWGARRARENKLTDLGQVP